MIYEPNRDHSNLNINLITAFLKQTSSKPAYYSTKKDAKILRDLSS